MRGLSCPARKEKRQQRARARRTLKLWVGRGGSEARKNKGTPAWQADLRDATDANHVAEVDAEALLRLVAPRFHHLHLHISASEYACLQRSWSLIRSGAAVHDKLV